MAKDRDLDRSMDLLWSDQRRPPRGRRPGLNLRDIVVAAVEVADEVADDGVEGLSMRRVAERLGVGTMSLYRYVPGKAELLDLMLDHVIALPEDTEPEERGWREVLVEDAHTHWDLCMRHRWYPFVDQTRPILGPNGLRGLDRLIARLSSLDLPDRERFMLIAAQTDLVETVARSALLEQAAVRRTGLTSEQFWEAQEPALVQAMTSGLYPAMASLDDDVFDASYEDTLDFGLRRLHDGIEVHIARRHENGAPTGPTDGRG